WHSPPVPGWYPEIPSAHRYGSFPEPSPAPDHPHSPCCWKSCSRHTRPHRSWTAHRLAPEKEKPRPAWPPASRRSHPFLAHRDQRIMNVANVKLDFIFLRRHYNPSISKEYRTSYSFSLLIQVSVLL